MLIIDLQMMQTDHGDPAIRAHHTRCRPKHANAAVYSYSFFGLMYLANHNRFLGDIQQTAPVYSALKVGSQRMSDLARKGIHVEPKTRPVTIHSISLTELRPPHFALGELDFMTFNIFWMISNREHTTDVACGGGTYVRSIIHDLGHGDARSK